MRIATSITVKQLVEVALMSELAHDLSYLVRQLRKSMGFTVRSQERHMGGAQ